MSDKIFSKNSCNTDTQVLRGMVEWIECKTAMPEYYTDYRHVANYEHFEEWVMAVSKFILEQNNKPKKVNIFDF